MDSVRTGLEVLLAQESPARGWWDRNDGTLAVIGIIIAGVALGVGLLSLLRNRQTPPDQMPRSQRWLLLVLIAVLIGGCIVAVILR